MNSRKRMAFIRIAIAAVAFFCFGYLALRQIPRFDFWTLFSFFALYVLWSIVETMIYEPPDSLVVDDDDRRSYLYMQLSSLAVLFYALLDFVALHLTRLPRYEPQVIEAGFAVLLLSFFIRYRALKALGKFYNPRVSVYEDHILIEHGAYKRIRHPFYLSALLSALSISMIMNSWGALLITLIGVVPALIYRINLEEAFLLEHLGERYQAYQWKTKRLVPWIW